MCSKYFISTINNINAIGRKVMFLFSILMVLIAGVRLSNGSAPSPKSEIEKLPFCGNESRDISRRLLFVSTLDGKLSALDLVNGGSLKWSVSTSPGGLLSSSIHRLELTNNGQWVRMIPSLNGGLYKFDGETIEPIPVSADHLLSASFKFSDDLIISGGKETRSYGISTRSGKVVYECSMHGCKNTTNNNSDELDHTGSFEISDDDHDPLVDEIIVVRRQTQTVRAVEPRTGGERWNFSVGHHELDVLKAENCHERPYTELEKTLLEVQLKVIVPEGIVCAVQKENPNVILWKYQFDHPIVSAWKTSLNDELVDVDLFSYSHWPWSIDEMPQNYENLSPSLYVGMFKKQLYIQESNLLKKIIQTNIYSSEYLESTANALRVPWKPLAATSAGLTLLENDQSEHEKESNKASTSVTALSILYGSEYVNGNGFFLYSSDDLNITQTAHCNKHNATYEHIDEDTLDYQYTTADTPTQIIIVSLWYWWKQIIVISLVTALILNIFLSRRMPSEREVVIVERHVEVKVPVVLPQSIESSNEFQTRRSNSESSSNTSNFTSRFSTDFDLVQCLGKGGFGVVFEARNKLDDCNYAIKRIILPNRQESRDRVMREVKTLAHCEHQHIVRYFQAWVETPPPAWQENEDKLWMEKDILSHSIDIPSPTDATPAPKKVINEVINKNNDKALDLWISNLQTNECINFDDSNRKTTFATDNTTTNDSFIQFKNSTCGHNEDSLFSETSDDKSTNHSYQLSRRNPTSDFNSDSIFNNRNDPDSNSSFEIEFKHSTNGFPDKSKNVSSDCPRTAITNGCDRNIWSTTGSDSCFVNLNHDVNRKPRTQSENRQDHVISINSTTTNNSYNLISETSTKNDKAKTFKKTHRRPLSLDLSRAAGGVCGNRENFTLPPSKMYLYIQMQLCKKQSLRDWLRNTNQQARQKEIVPIFKQIVDAVEYVHLKGLIHRDLKPSNIFFSLDGQIKIGDFGLVTDMSMSNTPCGNNESKSPLCAKHTQKVGTYLYMSPEQIQGLQYNYKVDIYSLGFIFFELLVVFGTEMERIETLKALRLNKFPNQFCSLFKDEYDLLKMMLSESPNQRPTTIGIRSRPPLGNGLSGSMECHFELPPRRRDSHLSISRS